MKINKKIIKETVNINEPSVRTFGKKKQNIIVTESQLEKLLEIISKK